MFLLDTNVISALAPTRRRDSAVVVDWLDRASSHLFLSVVTVSEILNGITKAEREGVGKKAASLREWWQVIEHLYADRLLPFDLKAAHAAGVILDQARAHKPGFEDVAIAATAKASGLTVLTANERHFDPLCVPVINPFKLLPHLPDEPRQ